MLQCPHCSHRTFETEVNINARVRVTGHEAGDYSEEEIERYATDWETLECCQCGQMCVEGTARDAFEAGSGQWLDDDIYHWYAGQTADCPQEDTPAHESYARVAAAWQCWRWQLDHGYNPLLALEREKD